MEAEIEKGVKTRLRRDFRNYGTTNDKGSNNFEDFKRKWYSEHGDQVREQVRKRVLTKQDERERKEKLEKEMTEEAAKIKAKQAEKEKAKKAKENAKQGQKAKTSERAEQVGKPTSIEVEMPDGNDDLVVLDERQTENQIESASDGGGKPAERIATPEQSRTAEQEKSKLPIKEAPQPAENRKRRRVDTGPSTDTMTVPTKG